MLRQRIAEPLRRYGWPLALVALALVLALLGQGQLQGPEPQVTTGLLSLAVAAWVLTLLRPREEPALRLSRPALVAFGFAALGALATLFQHARPELIVAGRMIPTWLLGMAAFAAGCAFVDRDRSDIRPLELGWTRTDTIAVVALMLIGGFFRFSELGRIPLTMSGDEGNMAMEAVRIRNDVIKDPFTTGWLSHPTLWFYLQAVSISWFGETLAGVRMLSAVIGTLTMASGYFFARLLFGQRIALLAGLLLATYHLHIHFSRLALNNVADPFFGTLILSAWVIGLRTRRLLAFGLVGLGIGLALYFYHGARLFAPLLGLLTLLAALPHWRRWRELRSRATWLPVLFMALGLLVSGGPLMQTFLQRPEEFMARINIQRWTSEDIRLEAERSGRSELTVVLDQAKRSFLAFNTYPDVSTFYDDTRPLLWGLAGGLFVIGLLLALTRIRQHEYQILAVWFFLAILVGNMLLRNPPHSPRYVTLAPVVCILIAFAIDYAAKAIEALGSSQRVRFATTIGAALLTTYLAGASINGYFRDYIQRENLGGINTHVAMALTEYLKEQPQGTKVWFMVPPRMYYHGFAMLDFLARHAEGQDVLEPITSPDLAPVAEPGRTTVYAATPERSAELEWIRQRYPGGEMRTLFWPLRQEALLFVYRVNQ